MESDIARTDWTESRVRAEGIGATNNQRRKNKFMGAIWERLKPKTKPIMRKIKLGYKITPM